MVIWLARLYSVLLFVYAVLSWLPDLRGPWVRYLAMVIEPVLAPVRRIIPPLGGFDLAFLVVLLVLNYLIVPLLVRAAFTACYVGF
ncbi:MAG: YggT family protein [bacterium]|nr:YggT family protein [bacterium]